MKTRTRIAILLVAALVGSAFLSQAPAAPAERHGDGTLYLMPGANQPGPSSASAAAASKSREPFLNRLFKKKKKPAAATSPTPGRVASSPAPSSQPSRSDAGAPREKKPGLLERLFGPKPNKKKPAQPAYTGPNPAQDATRIYDEVMAQSSRGNTRVVIDISKQRAYLLVNGQIGMDTPISTGRPGKPTPRGTHYMGQRVRTGKISTIYGVAMPYWMRLGGSLYGVHAGYLPGYPASAGCIRLPMESARFVFDHTQSGTRVSVLNSWPGYANALPASAQSSGLFANR